MNLYANQNLYLSQITQIYTEILSHADLADLADFFDHGSTRIYTDDFLSSRSRRFRRFLDEHALGDDRRRSFNKKITH